MTCARCKDLAIRYEIALPTDLRRAITVARDNVADGTIQLIACDSLSYPDQQPFHVVAEGGRWDDLVEYCFECTQCGQRFELVAECYHGSGGAWAPVNGSESAV